MSGNVVGDLDRPDGSSYAVVRPAAGASVIVLMILALTLISAIGFVAAYGANVPFGEDWEVMAPVLAGKQAITLQWLWSQSNEHRVPLPKLLLLGLSKLANSDFRAGMFFNVLALGAVSLAMIRAASRIRGRMSYCDCFFPLVFLHWGHFENLLWSWQVQFVPPVMAVAVNPVGRVSVTETFVPSVGAVPVFFITIE